MFILNFARHCPVVPQKGVLSYSPVNSTRRCLFPDIIFEKSQSASRPGCHEENGGVLSENLGAS